MMNRRAILLGGSALLLAACVDPLIDEEVARDLRVVSVTVDLSDFERVKGREITVPPEQVQADLQANLDQQLKLITQNGTRPVHVVVKIEKIWLVSPGQSFLVGGTSSITGQVYVTDATTKEVVLEPSKVVGTGTGYAPGGLIGALSTGNVEQDYRTTVAGFSQDVRDRLLGK